MSLDHGTALIVVALYNRVRMKKENKVHLLKEMTIKSPEDAGLQGYNEMVRSGYITYRMQGNASRARFHGLIASVGDDPGVFVLTRKGVDFLRGEKVPRTVIVEKRTHTNDGYFQPVTNVTDLATLTKKAPFWDMDMSYLPTIDVGQPTLI